MTMEPWTQLTQAQEARLRAAQDKVRRGDSLSALEQRAVDQFRARERERGFCELFHSLPQTALRMALGLDRKAAVKALGKRLGWSGDLSSGAVDLGELLAKLIEGGGVGEEPKDSQGGGDVIPEAIAIARTYRELADLLPLHCADPERTLKTYLARGMPGRPGRPGRADGWFPVAACRAWIEVHTKTAAMGGSDDLIELKERIVRLDLEIREREALEQLGRLADVTEVIAYTTSIVNDCKAMHDALPDEVLSLLPEDMEGDARRAIHQAVTRRVQTLQETLARMARGDDDPTDNDEPTSPTAGDDEAESGDR